MESVGVPHRIAEATCALSDYQFDLPAELIAQLPAERREDARLMVLGRDGQRRHTAVRELPHHLRPGDLLIVNDTKVVPARLFGRGPSGGAVEVLLVRALDASTWLCLGKPARRLRVGATIRFAEQAEATVVAVLGDGQYTIAFAANTSVSQLLEQHGEIPLPPYIHRPDGPVPLDRSRYQTIFAANPGAVAAPTAGLHFSDELVAALRHAGVDIARLTLHVGPGTFLPPRTADLRQHTMAPEWYEIPAATAAAIGHAKATGRRVVAVGTTTTRALESAAMGGDLRAGTGWAHLLITPGHVFRIVDALFTNFHLPGSTLLLLVSAFAGRERILDAYADAIAHRYRFYSYGDAMLLE